MKTGTFIALCNRLNAKIFALTLAASISFPAHAGSSADTGFAQPMHAAFAPMKPVFQKPSSLPKSKPDPALAYDAKPTLITIPESKPLLTEVLPKSTVTVSEMIKAQTGFKKSSNF